MTLRRKTPEKYKKTLENPKGIYLREKYYGKKITFSFPVFSLF